MALDPHINPVTNHWDDNYYANTGKYGGASGDPTLDSLNADANQYINQLISADQATRDLAVKQLDAQHQLALGNNDDQTAKFLESVASAAEQKMGRIPFDYQTYTGRENQGYQLDTQQTNQTRQLALQKLAEDERAQQTALNTQQGQANQGTAEDLNSRGLLNGMAPSGLTGGMPTTQGVGAITGIGSYAANQQNQDFANQRLALSNSIGLQQQGANLTADQQLAQRQFAHTNTLQDLQTSARRDAQDAQNTYQFGQQGANLSFQQQQDALNRQRLALQTQVPGRASTLRGYNVGYLGS